MMRQGELTLQYTENCLEIHVILPHWLAFLPSRPASGSGTVQSSISSNPGKNHSLLPSDKLGVNDAPS